VAKLSRGRRFGLPALVLVAVALVSGSAAAQPLAVGTAAAKKPGPLATLIKQSKNEDGIVVYGNPPGAVFQAFVDRFHYYYPWIKVTEYDLDDNVIFSRYASEAAQGVRTADLLIASAPNLWVYAARKGYAANFTPQDIGRFPKWAKQYPGIYIMSADPGIIVYNKLLLKDKVPQSLSEIAGDPGTYPKLTGYTVDNTFGYTGLYGYVQKKGWSNFDKIGGRFKAGGGVAAQLQLVAQGGAVLTYLTSPTARFTIKSNAQFAQILDWTYAKDATPIITRGIAVTKKASSPASARLFLNFIYTKAGQLAACDAGFTAFRNDYTPANGCTNTLADVYKKVGEKNVYVASFTQKFVNDRPAFAKRWHSIFG
jgi:iron(III) transport system substrate-binding protein